MRKTRIILTGAVAALAIGGLSVATASARNGADDPADKVEDVRGREAEPGDDRGRDRTVDDSPEAPETEHGDEGLEVEEEHGEIILKPHGGDDGPTTTVTPAPAPAPAPTTPTVPTTPSTIDDHGGNRAPGMTDDGPGDDHGGSGNSGSSGNSGKGSDNSGSGSGNSGSGNSGSGKGGSGKGGGNDDGPGHDVNDDHGGHGGDDLNDDH